MTISARDVLSYTETGVHPFKRYMHPDIIQGNRDNIKHFRNASTPTISEQYNKI
jgi:hypothetical protein